MNIENIAAALAPKKCWSANEEDFNCNSLGELLDNNEQLGAGSKVWSGEAITPAMSQLCSAQDVLDMMGDRSNEVAGEYADGYPDVSNEAEAALDALLSAWMTKYCPPSFYTVANVRPYMLTADDFTPRAD